MGEHGAIAWACVVCGVLRVGGWWAGMPHGQGWEWLGGSSLAYVRMVHGHRARACVGTWMWVAVLCLMWITASLLHHYMTKSLHAGITASLHHGITALIHHYIPASRHHCITAPLVTALLHCCFTTLLYHCIQDCNSALLHRYTTALWHH